MIDSDTMQYIKGLGLDHLKWFDGEPFDDTDIVFLVTKWNEEQFHLTVGKASGNSFMDADDLSWSGPVRWVKAWAEIEIPATVKGYSPRAALENLTNEAKAKIKELRE